MEGSGVTQNERRELWTKIHRWSGLAMVAFLALAALTGCVLAIKRPIDRALNSDLFHNSATAPSMSPFVAVERFRLANPGIVVLAMPAHAYDDLNIHVGVGAKPGAPPLGYDQVFLDRVDGHVVGRRKDEPSWGRRGIMEQLRLLHYTLLMGDLGRWLMGLMALTWLLGNLVGIYLTWPRKRPYWQSWKRMWRFSFKSTFARLLLDLHRASGLWVLIGITILAFTSVCFNFYDEVFTPALHTVTTPVKTPFDAEPPYPEGTVPKLSYEQALARTEALAESKVGNWKASTVTYGTAWNAYGVTFTDDGTVNYRKLGSIGYYIDGNTGKLIHSFNPYDGSDSGLAIERSLYPLHTGQMFGTVTVILVVLFALATIEMCVTGVYVWWKKRKGRAAAARAMKARAAREAQPA